MEDGAGSPMQSPVHSPTLQRAVNVQTCELLRAVTATVGDLSTAVAQTNVQQARTTQHMQALSDFLAIRPHDGGRRPEFHGDPARFDGLGDVKVWLGTPELIFDANGLTPEECVLHTLPMLSKSAL